MAKKKKVHPETDSDEEDEGGEEEQLHFKLVAPPSEIVESLGNIDYVFEGGKKTKKDSEDEDDSSSVNENYKNAKKAVKA